MGAQEILTLLEWAEAMEPDRRLQVEDAMARFCRSRSLASIWW